MGTVQRRSTEDINVEIANGKDIPENLRFEKLPKYIKFDTNDEWLNFKQKYLGNRGGWSYDDRLRVFVKSAK